MTNFFLPLRASSNKTPQPSPGHHAALQYILSQEEQQYMQDFVGTPERLSALREACLPRDRHRCVVSRAFNKAEAITRFRDQGPAVDNDGDPLFGNTYAHVEVAHIIPYGLTKSGDGMLDEPKQSAIIILNMFDLGVVHLIEGTDINRPYNGITLSLEMHKSFGQYDIFFDRVPDSPPHTYRISTFLPPGLEDLLPITRNLFSHSTIDPPSERLLGLHRAVAYILHLSGAGDYINKILRDMEDGVVRGDGSTELGVLVDLALKVR
ncbi:hypothetical protein B0H67DRAFT_653351 [Lasiosphaeris hirsuta]|uniref:HNH nuclease domain-containing protein n=1 Tax=Lasiosphaeris hirsuta TaxID=260670 RepID=A0AA40ED12_9PEZI|nr:hypothetical protein B0H67DRAFT_653351 [Lasiosphaeris hirsuta]